MKKTYLSLIALLCGLSSSYAQWSTPDASGRIFYNGGNVGIGTTTPQSAFNVISNMVSDAQYQSGLRIDDNAASSNVALLAGVSNTRNAGYIQTVQPNVSWVTRALSLQPNGGYVGIGTTSPGASIEIDASNTTSFTHSLFLAPSLSDNNYMTIGFGQSNTSARNGELFFSLGTSAASYSDSFVGLQNNGDAVGAGIVVKKGGYVGIGTISPAAQLHLAGSSSALSAILDGASGNYLSIREAGVAASYLGNGRAILTGAPTGSTGLRAEGALTFGSGGDNLRMTIAGNGFVGIGTTSPDEKLTVNGTIHTTEVKVTVSVFPDYVFKPAYHLPKLSDVKTYIDRNHHLPEVPTEAEVAKNGLNVGQSETLLLKKVEELTLYLIDQQKLLIKQQKEIDKLKRKPAYKK